MGWFSTACVTRLLSTSHRRLPFMVVTKLFYVTAQKIEKKGVKKIACWFWNYVHTWRINIVIIILIVWMHEELFSVLFTDDSIFLSLSFTRPIIYFHIPKKKYEITIKEYFWKLLTYWIGVWHFYKIKMVFLDRILATDSIKINE